MKKRILRIAVLTAGATGVLGLLAGVAEARIAVNHCEPVR
jgi:hypothetical protein